MLAAEVAVLRYEWMNERGCSAADLCDDQREGWAPLGAQECHSCVAAWRRKPRKLHRRFAGAGQGLQRCLHLLPQGAVLQPAGGQLENGLHMACGEVNRSQAYGGGFCRASSLAMVPCRASHALAEDDLLLLAHDTRV